MRKFLLAVLAALVLAGSAGAGRASELSDFNDATAEAYRHYRAAVSYLRTGNAALAAIELEAAAGRWRDVTGRFAANPPDAFAGDPAWGATLTGIGQSIGQALTSTDAGDLKRARETLAPVRGELGALRRRNGVIVFSDRVDEVTAAMDRLWRFRHERPDFGAAGTLRELTRGTAVLEHLLQRCQEEAPAALRNDPDFVRFLDSAAEGMERLWQAIEGRDEQLLINTLRELRSFERLFFLRFG
ncbi:MAG: hypothetical protein OEU09_06530 [Rhodospirillales bacterium]|nr:hypothetical protein [Rhodospirillales bacterium]MDH3793144.1 hypothetical protein [Rhodospirillales bacterium]MDH3910937.1 hypothetical protein [Rhodospirillales bacterium]MDH3917172.1 hypothetical protein [Rhodospirillales bacterium]MDH3968959.1 hypothetical protein [Rhodospirillales bacterium]